MPTNTDPKRPGDEVRPGTPQSGENICRRCSGKGRQSDGKTCSECGGSGRITTLIGDA